MTFGVLTIWGASLLILFLIAATALFHNFLMFNGAERQPHIYFTLVNCALAGYCLFGHRHRPLIAWRPAAGGLMRFAFLGEGGRSRASLAKSDP